MRLTYLLALSVAVPFSAIGAPFDMFISQRNIADTATLTRTISSPGLGVPGIMVYRATDNFPAIYRMGNSFMLNGSTLETASDWVHVTNKPIFAPVATSGDYNDLTNKPSMPGAPVNADWDAVGGLAEILNKPELSAVATSGAYSDLSGAPSIPAAQVNSDWSAAAGISQILNKPTNLAGYGITDAYPLSGNPAGFLTGITSGQVTAALGFTPYSASNPSSFIGQAGARSAISLTTSGTAGAATYNSATGVLNIPNYAPGAGTVTSVTAGAGLSGGTFTTSGTISMPSVGAAGTYSGVTTDAQGRVNAGTNRSQGPVTRPLNTAFQPSATRDVDARYSVQCQVTASITGGQNCDIFLEIASDQAFTTNVQQVGVVGQGQVYTLAIALQGVQPQTQQVIGYIPAGYWARIRTAQNLGSPTFAYRLGQEVLQ